MRRGTFLSNNRRSQENENKSAVAMHGNPFRELRTCPGGAPSVSASNAKHLWLYRQRYDDA